MKAVKRNKEYTIEEAQRKSYQGAGYDILDGDGKVIAHGRGKTVPYEDYAAVKAECEELKRKLDASETGSAEKKGKTPGKAGG